VVVEPSGAVTVMVTVFAPVVNFCTLNCSPLDIKAAAGVSAVLLASVAVTATVAPVRLPPSAVVSPRAFGTAVKKIPEKPSGIVTE